MAERHLCYSLGQSWWPGRKVGFVLVGSEAVEWQPEISAENLYSTMQPVFIKPFLTGTNLRKRQLLQGPYAMAGSLWAVCEGDKTTKNPCWTGDLNANCYVDFCPTAWCRGSWLGLVPCTAVRKVLNSVAITIQIVAFCWFWILCDIVLDLFHSHRDGCGELHF